MQQHTSAFSAKHQSCVVVLGLNIVWRAEFWIGLHFGIQPASEVEWDGNTLTRRMKWDLKIFTCLKYVLWGADVQKNLRAIHSEVSMMLFGRCITSYSSSDMKGSQRITLKSPE